MQVLNFTFTNVNLPTTNRIVLIFLRIYLNTISMSENKKARKTI